MSTDQPPAAVPTPGTERESQWKIVGRMFRKRRTAVWGLRGAAVLLLIAIFAPLISAGLPLVWRVPGGETQYPWLRRMFDTNYWQNGVDRFFNFLMILVAVWVVLRLLESLGRVVGLYIKDPVRDAKVKRVVRWSFVGVGGLVAVAQMLGWSALTTSEPYVDYRAEAKRYTQAAEHLAHWREATAAGKATEAAEALRLAVEADSQIPQMRADDSSFDGSDYSHTALFPPIPYGHREQLPRLKDRFRDVWDFEDGEVHLLGTDKVGRDVMARLIYGTRISLTVGLVAVAIYVSIGVFFGSLAGFFGGKTDLFIMRAVEIILCVPGLFLILTIVALFGERSIFIVMFAIGIVGWTGIARLIRGEFIRERARDYVVAARSLGLSSGRILFRHVMPNAIAPVIVSATFGVAGAIIVESTLSFLGLGDPNVPSWGMILDDGRLEREWHMILAPGVAIFMTVTLLNLVGDGLRDALDPKLRN